MSYDPHREDYQRLGLRFARSLDGKDPAAATRAFASFGRRFSQNRDSLPQSDADRAFHLVAEATTLIDYELPFADDAHAEELIERGHRLLDEALALDGRCHDALRMKQAAESTSFESYYDFLAKSADGLAEAVAGFGTVEGAPVYAFAQNSDVCGGAMSKAQAAKLKKIYDLALKTGAPVVGFYDSNGGRLTQGAELLAGCGDVLNSAASLSGVVPQISVVLGNCLGTNALNAVSADIVIMSKKAKLSLSVTEENADADYNYSNGNAAIVADDSDKAIKAARELILYLPSNNLTMPPQSFDEQPVDDGCGCIVRHCRRV